MHTKGQEVHCISCHFPAAPLSLGTERGSRKGSLALCMHSRSMSFQKTASPPRWNIFCKVCRLADGLHSALARSWPSELICTLFCHLFWTRNFLGSPLLLQSFSHNQFPAVIHSILLLIYCDMYLGFTSLMLGCGLLGIQFAQVRTCHWPFIWTQSRFDLGQLVCTLCFWPPLLQCVSMLLLFELSNCILFSRLFPIFLLFYNRF